MFSKGSLSKPIPKIAVILLVVVMLALDEPIGLEDGTEPLTGVAGLVPDVLKMLKVTGDLALVPGQQDRLDVGKVLVEGRSPDTGPLGYLRHRHRRRSLLGH